MGILAGFLFPGGHVQRMCRGRGLPPLSLLRVYSLSSLGLVRRWSWRGAVRQAGEPPGGSQDPPSQGGCLQYHQLYCGQGKAFGGLRVGGSLTPPFHTLNVARRKREGSRNAGILARPCPNRLGW